MGGRITRSGRLAKSLRRRALPAVAGDNRWEVNLLREKEQGLTRRLSRLEARWGRRDLYDSFSKLGATTEEV